MAKKAKKQKPAPVDPAEQVTEVVPKPKTGAAAPPVAPKPK